MNFTHNGSAGMEIGDAKAARNVMVVATKYSTSGLS